MYDTRPNPKRGTHAVVRVQDLETLEQYQMDTEHAVLNVPTEVGAFTTLFSRRDVSKSYRVGSKDGLRRV